MIKDYRFYPAFLFSFSFQNEYRQHFKDQLVYIKNKALLQPQMQEISEGLTKFAAGQVFEQCNLSASYTVQIDTKKKRYCSVF